MSVIYVDRGADGGELEADILFPSGTPTFIAAAIPGNGFAVGVKEWMSGIAHHLQSLGGVVISMDYRGAPEHPYPAGRMDVNEACRYLQIHEDEYAPPNLPFLVFGSSAGGCDGALAAEFLRKQAYAVSAAVLWSGCYDFDDAVSSSWGGNQVHDLLMGFSVDAPTQEQLDDASPIKNLHKITERGQQVKWFLVCGEDESPGIPASQSEAMYQALLDAGQTAKLKVVPGGQHGTQLMNTGGWAPTAEFLMEWLG